ncbi:MAG: ATP-binding cassette domain-containing protein [Desulfovibrio sp.]|nr:MAG: ATP-binding cassette domain-containing protein [Desulfovibrio sp.]
MGLSVAVTKKMDHAVLDVEFCCGSGALLCLVGPSGAGKTTLVRTIAGLEKPDMGRVALNGRAWTDTARSLHVPVRKRSLGFVFQDSPLLPHLSLEKNVLFGGADPDLTEELLFRLGIAHLKHKKPRALSGGERQRGALAQALARRPSVLLLDEPFSSLDLRTRRSLQGILMEYTEALAMPVIMVTHDLYEARAMGDRVLCLNQGRIDAHWMDEVLAEPGPGAPMAEEAYSMATACRMAEGLNANICDTSTQVE